MSEVKYKFYPSLLDSFQSYLDCEASYEEYFGFADVPSQSFEEYEKKKFKELIDKINRVPFDSEAADKGTCFNEIIDCILLREKSTRDDVSICTRQTLVEEEVIGTIDPCNGKVIDADVEFYERQLPHIEAQKGERTYLFDIAFCKNAADYFRGSLPQVYTEATISTKYGKVLLYGYIDYLRGNKVFDAKTTKKYDFGKYRKYWQQHVYPWALIESGKCTEISSFEFTAFQLKGGNSKKAPLISGEMYKEVYTYDHARSTQLLTTICEHFIEFIENNKNLITDKKIFGGEKAE